MKVAKNEVWDDNDIKICPKKGPTMESIQNDHVVKEQYKNEANLQTRISIHEKYSVNKQGFGNWIFEQYRLAEHLNVLELGCGNADMWKENAKKLPTNMNLILSDFSQGMLSNARNNIGEYDQISLEQIDIQQIPYQDKNFDIIIANMMLYHVPDIHKGLSEVRRVLKENGLFYCATYGENGIIEYIQDLLGDFGIQRSKDKVFTLQSGEQILRKHFETVEKLEYNDHLEVTNTEDLADYALSLSSMIDLSNVSRNDLITILEKQKVDGRIYVPKEYGMFIVS